MSDPGRLLARFSSLRVLVVGDLMADEHLWGQVRRISPEAPVPVVEVERETFVPGGAANAAHQLAALGAQVAVAGVVGDDSAGERLREAFIAMGVDTRAVVTTTDRATTRKTRITAASYQGAQQIVRVDRESAAPLPEATATALLQQCQEVLSGCQAVLLSDYRKGVLTPSTVVALVAQARAGGALVCANPKPASLSSYAGADLVQLNRREADEAAALLLGVGEGGISDETGERLRAAASVRGLLVTRGARGLTLFEAAGATHIPAIPVEVFDGTGAGDSTIAAATLGLAAGGTLTEAVVIGNAAGSAVVRKAGVATARAEELYAILLPLG